MNNITPTQYCEKHGIIDATIKKNCIIYYISNPAYLNEPHYSYKVMVDINTYKETRQRLKKYTKKGEPNRYR